MTNGEERAANSAAASTALIILAVVVVIALIAYFAWYAPSQNAAMDRPDTEIDVQVPSAPAPDVDLPDVNVTPPAVGGSGETGESGSATGGGTDAGTDTGTESTGGTDTGP